MILVKPRYLFNKRRKIVWQQRSAAMVTFKMYTIIFEEAVARGDFLKLLMKPRQKSRKK